MTKLKDLTGMKFGRLTVIEKLENKKYHKVYWLCKCECGNTKIIRQDHLKSKKIQSCGCLQKEITSKIKSKHNMTGTRIYVIWEHIKQRCINTKCKDYYLYGKRNIKMCEEWKKDFLNFYNWSMSSGYKDDLTIDRIDVNGNYEPNNCRWITNAEQSRNRRTNILITYNSETYCIKEWAEKLKIKYNTLWARLSVYHWSIEKAFNTKVGSKKNGTY